MALINCNIVDDDSFIHGYSNSYFSGIVATGNADLFASKFCDDPPREIFYSQISILYFDLGK